MRQSAIALLVFCTAIVVTVVECGEVDEEVDESLLSYLAHKTYDVHSVYAPLPLHLYRAEKQLEKARYGCKTVVAIHCDFVHSVILSIYFNSAHVRCIQSETNNNASLITDRYFTFATYRPLSDGWQAGVAGLPYPIDAVLDLSENNATMSLEWLEALAPRISPRGVYVMASGSNSERASSILKLPPFGGGNNCTLAMTYDPPSIVVRRRTLHQQQTHHRRQQQDQYAPYNENPFGHLQAPHDESISAQQKRQVANQEDGFQPVEDGERFLFYYANYGRFNNQRRYLYDAIAIANALNRTLCLPSIPTHSEVTGRKGFNPIGAYLDLQVLESRVKFKVCKNFRSSETLITDGEERDPQNPDQYQPFWFTNRTINAKYGGNNATLIYFGLIVDSWDFGEIKQSGLSAKWEKEDAPLFGVPRSVLSRKVWPKQIFSFRTWENQETDEFRWIRTGVVAHYEIRNNVAEVVQDYLRGRPFIGVHLRIENWEVWECPVCCHSSDPMYHVNRTVAIAKEHGIFDVVVGLDPSLEEANIDTHLQDAGLDVLSIPSRYDDALTQQLLEQGVLAQATIFIGSLCSTFSMAVHEERFMILGKDKNSSMWW